MLEELERTFAQFGLGKMSLALNKKCVDISANISERYSEHCSIPPGKAIYIPRTVIGVESCPDISWHLPNMEMMPSKSSLPRIPEYFNSPWVIL
jgi:hypothetical protein